MAIGRLHVDNNNIKVNSILVLCILRKSWVLPIVNWFILVSPSLFWRNSSKPSSYKEVKVVQKDNKRIILIDIFLSIQNDICVKCLLSQTGEKTLWTPFPDQVSINSINQDLLKDILLSWFQHLDLTNLDKHSVEIKILVLASVARDLWGLWTISSGSGLWMI